MIWDLTIWQSTGDGRVDTPNLDRFAAQGVHFTRNYTDSTCAATRAGVLTGLSPVTVGFRQGGLGISPEVTTLPEALREGGIQYPPCWQVAPGPRQPAGLAHRPGLRQFLRLSQPTPAAAVPPVRVERWLAGRGIAIPGCRSRISRRVSTAATSPICCCRGPCQSSGLPLPASIPGF